MPQYPQIGYKVVAKVLEVGGKCTIGLKPGEEYEVSIHRCGDFCGIFYHNIFQWIVSLQLGAKSPFGDDPDVMVWECPNPNGKVKVELRRVK